MNKKWIFTTIFLLAVALGRTQAQMTSPVGIGIRANPDGAGFTGKFALDNRWAIEAQLNGSMGFAAGPTNSPGYGPSFTAVGLLEYHWFFSDPSWQIYAGPGIHGGVWDKYNHRMYETHEEAMPIFGIDGIVGVEYVFKKVPIGISVDMKPAINFVSEVDFFPNNFFGLSGRYYVGHVMPRKQAPRVR